LKNEKFVKRKYQHLIRQEASSILAAGLAKRPKHTGRYGHTVGAGYSPLAPPCG